MAGRLHCCPEKTLDMPQLCDTVGHLSGFLIGNAVFLGLTTTDFSNRYLRTQPSPKGVVTLAGFFHFWGIVFLVATTLIGLFKHEKSEQELHGKESIEGIVDGYKTLIQILRCPGILRFVPILLTFKVRSENNMLNNMHCSLQMGSHLGAQARAAEPLHQTSFLRIASLAYSLFAFSQAKNPKIIVFYSDFFL